MRNSFFVTTEPVLVWLLLGIPRESQLQDWVRSQAYKEWLEMLERAVKRADGATRPLIGICDLLLSPPSPPGLSAGEVVELRVKHLMAARNFAWQTVNVLRTLEHFGNGMSEKLFEDIRSSSVGQSRFADFGQASV